MNKSQNPSKSFPDDFEIDQNTSENSPNEKVSQIKAKQIVLNQARTDMNSPEKQAEK